MNDFLTQLSEILNLQYSKDYMTIYGQYRNCKLSINSYIQNEHLNNLVYSINIPFSKVNLPTDNSLDSLINSLKENHTDILSCNFISNTIHNSLSIHLYSVSDNDTNINNITNIINEVSDFVELHSLKSCCERCKEDKPITPHDINNNLFLLCNDCYVNYEEHLKNLAIENQKEYEKSLKKPNIIAGTIGALLGSLIGVALWIIVFQIGYIASICGVVLAICAMKGFELFSGRLTKSGVIVTIIITIVMVYISNHLSYGIDIYNYYRVTENITIWDGIRSVGSFVSEIPEFKQDFIKTLCMGYGFTLLGAFSTFKSALQSK